MEDINIGVYYKPPCGACHTEDGRTPGCHDKCDRYQKFKLERKRKKEMLIRDNQNKTWKKY